MRASDSTVFLIILLTLPLCVLFSSPFSMSNVLPLASFCCVLLPFAYRFPLNCSCPFFSLFACCFSSLFVVFLFFFLLCLPLIISVPTASWCHRRHRNRVSHPHSQPTACNTQLLLHASWTVVLTVVLESLSPPPSWSSYTGENSDTQLPFLKSARRPNDGILLLLLLLVIFLLPLLLLIPHLFFILILFPSSGAAFCATASRPAKRSCSKDLPSGSSRPAPQSTTKSPSSTPPRTNVQSALSLTTLPLDLRHRHSSQTYGQRSEPMPCQWCLMTSRTSDAPASIMCLRVPGLSCSTRDSWRAQVLHHGC